jgi:hypothetical protein
MLTKLGTIAVGLVVVGLVAMGIIALANLPTCDTACLYKDLAAQRTQCENAGGRWNYDPNFVPEYSCVFDSKKTK